MELGTTEDEVDVPTGIELTDPDAAGAATDDKAKEQNMRAAESLNTMSMRDSEGLDKSCCLFKPLFIVQVHPAVASHWHASRIGS